jgi:hypothetical protein
MTARQIAIRIGLEGQADVQRGMQDIGGTGDAVFGDLGKSIDQATSAIQRQEAAERQLTEAQKNAQTQQANQTSFSRFMGVNDNMASSARDASKVFEAEFDRVAAVAQMKAEQIGQSFQSTLTAAFGIGAGAKSAQDSASAFEAEFDQAAAIAQMKAEQVGQNFQNTLNAAFGVGVGAKSAKDSAAVFSDADAAQTAMQQRAAALREQIDPLSASQVRLNAALSDADELYDKGALGQAEYTAAVYLAHKSFDDTKASLAALSEGEAISVTKARELGEGFLHLAENAASGGLSLRQLSMAAGDFMRASEGQGIGALVGSIVANPLVDIIAGVVATGVAVVLAFNRAEDAEHALEQATTGAGRAVGATRDQIESFAESAANADNISVNAARDIEVAFAKTGSVGGTQLKGLIDLTVQYAHATGQSMDEAQNALVKAFADPAKAGEQLLAGLGALDDKTAQYIQTAMASNDTARAQAILMEALKNSIKDAEDQTGFWTGIWDSIKQHASDAIEVMSRGLEAVPLAAQKTALQTELALAQKGQGLVQYDPESHSTRQTSMPRPIPDILADLGRVNAAIDQTDKKAKQTAADAAATKLSLVAGPIVRAATPGFEDEQSLNKNKAAMDQLAGNSLAQQKAAVTAREVAGAQDAYTHAISSYLDPAAKAQKLDELQIAALKAKTPAQKEAIAEQQKAVELSGKVVTTAEANREIQMAGAKAYAEATANIDKQAVAYIALAEAYLKGAASGEAAEAGAKKLGDAAGKAMDQGAKQAAQLDYENEARKKLNDQVAAGTMTSEQASREMETQTAIAPLLIAQAFAEGDAKKELAKVIAALTAAREKDNTEQTRTKALALRTQGDQNIDLLKQELAIANDNDGARQVETAALQAKQQLLNDNIKAESDEGKQIIANAQQAVILNQQLDLAKSSRGEVEDVFDSMSSKFSSFIVQGKFGWKDFQKLGLGVLQDFEGDLLKLGVINPLKNMTFGTNLPTGDSVGGALGSLFGGGTPGAGVAIPGVKPDGSLDAPFYVIMSPLSSSLGGLFDFGGDGANDDSGILTDVASLVSTFHEGGVAGSFSNVRYVPSSAFRGAPRYHGGGLAGDEVPAILKRGERVLNLEETKASFDRQSSASSKGARQQSGMYFDLRGAVMTEDLLAQMNAMASRAERNATASALKQARRVNANWQQQDFYEHG